ncbi:hypothetical protein BS50DRAFT_605927 [Corynespora cassiicola Philippines]|uniref:Uncharacterized protein n=1 Tax=Corynespora cassiicola Philippines TaxID=1448308 RepID=A0A2T2P9T1_CORCC|nr:hypothetical protein BS50DRAFT_605927 [Corynespora cassiicola Philippines]
MTLSTRQPFAELGTPRLQALSSTKNRQNAVASFSPSTLKPAPTPTTGKRRAAAVFDDQDSENVDPSVFNSPTKKSKTGDGYTKPSRYSLTALPSQSSPASTGSPAIPSVRKALSSPNSSTSTPISHSRGSPKHKRVGLLSKRRVSSSPFRRVDPPTFTQSSPALPFSIDAALSGTIPSYTPKQPISTPVVTPTPTPTPVSALDESMPKSWFFEIHEDTPEQEAANLMEHSAAVLDISSDDDMATKKIHEELERGKENIPPPDFALAQPRNASVGATDADYVKLPRLKSIAQDAMDEDRSPLSDLPPANFYGEGLDATSYATVDVSLSKPSGLSKEYEIDCSSEETPVEQETAPAAQKNAANNSKKIQKRAAEDASGSACP